MGNKFDLLSFHLVGRVKQIIASKFSSAQDGIYALGKAYMRSTPSLRSFPDVVFETIPMFV